MDTADPSLFSTPELSYDDTLSYSEQIPTTVSESTSVAEFLDESSSTEPHGSSLADRIGRGKVYLLEDVTASASTSRASKRKRGDEAAPEEVAEALEEDMDADSNIRANALLLQGSPITHLPTARIFAYATHFDTHPIGLEWISDTTCILVFPSSSSARIAYSSLQKIKVGPDSLPAEDDEGFVTAKSIPMAFWPAEERINASLGKGEGLKGTILMRWARIDDVKKKRAKEESAFYRKYGMDAGKEAEKRTKDLEARMDPRSELESRLSGTDVSSKRRRTETDKDKKDELDRELEGFLKADSEDEVEEPPSKMRSDYLDGGRHGRAKSLLERTSELRSHPSASLADRIVARLPRRARRDSPPDRAPREHTGRAPPTKKSQQELDDELDAFLTGRG